ncbi:MAG: Drug resistance transporter EmrB/QacA subfamily [Deltaproteobacteria bacterium]|nr:Drug resistance transporter EmrB/QacA subfamily [Deltaproteobacteria bacterium]
MSWSSDNDAVGIRVLLSVGLGTLMSALDASVVNTVLPVIRAEYRVPVGVIQWVSTTYLLIMGSLLLTFGRLGDLRGHKRVYLAGIMVFVPASVLCGISPSVEMLIAARVLQGIGAAIVVSTAPPILIGSVHPSRMGQVLGLQAAMTSVGLALGPSLGGWLTDQWGWRTIFFMNVPIGAAAFAIGLRHIPGEKNPPPRGETFDRAGAFLFLAAFLALQVALSRGNDWGWLSAPTLGVFAGGAALGYLFLRQEMSAPSPMLHLALFRDRLFSFSVGSALVNYLCMASVLFLVPFYLIQGRGFSAAKAGMIMTAQFLSMVVTAPVSGRIADRVGSRGPATTGMAVLAVGLFLLSAMNGESPLPLVVAGLMVTGVGVAIFVTPNNSAMLGAAPPGRKGIASGILATSRLLGMATGISFAGAVLAAIVGGRSVHGISPERVFEATHLAFLATGLLASAGTVLTAARSERKSPQRAQGKTIRVDGNVPQEVDPVRQAPN